MVPRVSINAAAPGNTQEPDMSCYLLTFLQENHPNKHQLFCGARLNSYSTVVQQVCTNVLLIPKRPLVHAVGALRHQHPRPRPARGWRIVAVRNLRGPKYKRHLATFLVQHHCWCLIG